MGKQVDKRWAERARCKGGGPVWFSTNKEDHLELYGVCARCPVYSECLQAAVAEGTHQVFRAGRWWE